MNRTSRTLEEMLGPIPANIQAEVDLSFEISDRIDALMRQRGLSKKQFAEALGRRPSEITKWLSGQHNFTIATLAMLSSFFGQPIITVGWTHIDFLDLTAAIDFYREKGAACHYKKGTLYHNEVVVFSFVDYRSGVHGVRTELLRGRAGV